MTIIYATKTIKLINDTLEADQGAAFRQLLKLRMPESPDAYEGKSDPFRSHLGGSLIGRECTRELFYNWRWVKAAWFEGKMLRLFNRGHLEEPRMVSLLQMIGTQVWQADQNGKQFRVSYFGGHFGSALDSVIDGCRDVDWQCGPGLSEYKTHNEKSFRKLETDGVRAAKWEHYVQQQIYMSSYNLQWSLYMATNKNTDEIYGEIVPSEPKIAQDYIGRAQQIIFTKEAPRRLSESPGFYKCKFCEYKSVCHGKQQPARNCRTCQFSEPQQDGSWVCLGYGVKLDKAKQMAGCKHYQLMEALK